MNPKKEILMQEEIRLMQCFIRDYLKHTHNLENRIHDLKIVKDPYYFYEDDECEEVKDVKVS